MGNSELVGFLIVFLIFGGINILFAFRIESLQKQLLFLQEQLSAQKKGEKNE